LVVLAFVSFVVFTVRSASRIIPPQTNGTTLADDTSIKPAMMEDQTHPVLLPKVYVVQWHNDTLGRTFFAAAFKKHDDAVRCFEDAKPIGFGGMRYILPVTKSCKSLSAYARDCESATEIPSNVHIVIVQQSAAGVHRVCVFETLDSAKQYAHTATHFGVRAAIFANAPVRDSYEGLDLSYESSKAKKSHRDDSLEESSSSEHAGFERKHCDPMPESLTSLFGGSIPPFLLRVMGSTKLHGRHRSVDSQNASVVSQIDEVTTMSSHGASHEKDEGVRFEEVD